MRTRVLVLGCLLLGEVAVAGPGGEPASRFKRLHPATAEATSYLRGNWNRFEENYHPSYAFDDDPATAWVEGREGQGIGEAVRVRLSALPSARAVELRIRNGYQKSPRLYRANGRPKVLTARLFDAKREPVLTRDLPLRDTLDEQRFELPLPAGRGFAELELTVAAVYPGAKYSDTCLGDVAVSVDSDVPYSAAVEGGKREALRAWIRERREAAAYFARLPPAYPFADTHFGEEGKTEKRTLEPSPDHPMLAKRLAGAPLWPELSPTIEAPRLARMAELFRTSRSLLRSKSWYRTARKHPVRPPELAAGDGLGHPIGVLLADVADLLAPDNVAFFEATTPIASERRAKEDFLRSEVRSNVKVEWAGAPGGAARFAAFTVERTYSERSVWTERYEYLLSWDEKGRLAELLAFLPELTDEGARFEQMLHLRFLHDAGGKVHGIDAAGIETTELLEDDADEAAKAPEPIQVQGWRTRLVPEAVARRPK